MEWYDAWIRKTLKMLFSIVHREAQEKKIEILAQFIKFCTVGVSNTGLSYGINVLGLYLLRPYHLSWDFIVGNLVAFLLSVLWSFYWNIKYVFKAPENQKQNIGSALLKTYMAYGFTGICLTNLLSFIWINVFHISKYLAPLINTFICIPVNFLINKYWAFRRKDASYK